MPKRPREVAQQFDAQQFDTDISRAFCSLLCVHDSFNLEDVEKLKATINTSVEPTVTVDPPTAYTTFSLECQSTENINLKDVRFVLRACEYGMDCYVTGQLNGQPFTSEYVDVVEVEQTLDTENKALKAENQALKAENQALKAQVEALKATSEASNESPLNDQIAVLLVMQLLLFAGRIPEEPELDLAEYAFEQAQQFISDPPNSLLLFPKATAITRPEYKAMLKQGIKKLNGLGCWLCPSEIEHFGELFQVLEALDVDLPDPVPGHCVEIIWFLFSIASSLPVSFPVAGLSDCVFLKAVKTDPIYTSMKTFATSQGDDSVQYNHFVLMIRRGVDVLKKHKVWPPPDVLKGFGDLNVLLEIFNVPEHNVGH